jgi:hypothetical protein
MQVTGFSSKATKWLIQITFAVLALAVIMPGVARAEPPDHAGPPDKDEFFICPSVSTNNEHGMWVMGAHGAYYVLIPTKGGANAPSVVFVTVPVSVPDKAQIPAGWALYKDIDGYPNFSGKVMLLIEGIEVFLPDTGWGEGTMAMVTYDEGSNTTLMRKST